MNRGILLASLLVAACHHDATIKTTPAAAPAATATVTPAPTPVKQQDASPNLGVSQSLAEKCKLSFDSTAAAPKFGYDDNDLEPQDRDVLDRVATCLTTGPLRGKQVSLVGRTDPRGTEEYNLGLGSRRANSVSTYLQHLGVASKQLAVTTRGETQATGTDENGWRVDRRVDLDLQN